MHLMERLEDTSLPEEFLLVTCDVEFLYSNIRHEDGIRAVTEILNTQGSWAQCQEFIEHLNENNLQIRLTSQISDIMVDFLDLKLIRNGNQITTSLHRKETATNNVLHFGSFHPGHTRRGIPMGQFLRLRHNCSQMEDFKKHARDLMERLRVRGYPKKVISKAFQKALHSERNDLLKPRTRLEDTSLRLITPYNNQWNQIRQLLYQHWTILKSDSKLNSLIPSTPLLTAKRSRNLKDILTQSHFTRPRGKRNKRLEYIGSFPCGECSICQYMEPTWDFVDLREGTRLHLKQYINCKSRNVVYAILCPCNQVYVGQTTQELRKRIQKHLSTISLADRDFRSEKTLTSVAAHYRRYHAVSDLNWTIEGLFVK
ncbi:uncharacterized protein LOC130291827 isoform X2 [Hyla sarda]|uniref:uncharacterized protein LOC130291827 isoform X2 n=1 Tax=Hyla sarda TaxID=327740 RepID=UPI0024C41053|nr:uncharacterized protein LOC130291827 isoform X2 [Hyla sarda]